ncbi:MAG: sulfurtransferase [Anaerolineaceae bacterium]|nr:sulfurtransferase [Anaerolineaceae bacterium]
MNRNRMIIEADELLEKLDKENIQVYDATLLFFRNESDPTAYEQYLQEHIPGAAFFDHQQFSDPNSAYLLTILPEAELAEQIGAIGIAEDSEVILYSVGVLPAASRAWWILHYAGHNNVRVLNGGLAAWKKAGGKIEQGARQYEPGVYNGRFRSDAFAGKEEVQAAMENSEVGTLNTLPLESYEAAHITGSFCLPCTDLMQGMAAFLPDEELALRLQEKSQYKRIITYCGGGIAATVNAMAHLMMGHENVAVYDGSMSEWVGEGLPTEGTAEDNWEIWRQK